MKGKYQVFLEFAQSNDVSDFIRAKDKENVVSVLEALQELLNLMCDYDQYLRDENGPQNKFWQQYLDMVEILFDFRKSVTDGNWQLQNEC